MKLIIQKDRKAIPVGTYGTQNENEVTELTLKIPEEYQNWNKRIVFLTSKGNFWDYIQDDTYTIKNNITKFTSVRAYIWLTNDEQDFRTKEFTLSFWDNRNADNLIPTAEQIDGFNTLITTLNLEITTVTDLETELNGIITDLQNKLDTGYFKGEKGDTGDSGRDGQNGVDGQDGKSAYQTWLDEGNVGTEQDFLDSLKGEKGQDGENGVDGHDGVDGQDGQDGYTPVKGVDYWNSQDKAEIVSDVETDIQPTITTIQNTANTANSTANTAVSLAKLANQAKSYPTYQAFINYLNTAEKTEFIPGQSFMIQTKLIPDLWVYSVENTSVQYTYTTDEDFITYTNQATGGQVGYYKLAQLETQKVDLTNYYTKTQTDTLLGAKVDKSSFVYDSNTETLSITIS